MKIIRGNLWDSKDEIILVTANSYVNSRGELVMGRGAALELRNKIPYSANFFGNAIKESCGHLGRYGIILFQPPNDKFYGIFQVKYHFKANADVRLIRYSALELWRLLNNDSLLEGMNVSMNFPGVGWGRLDMNDVLPAIEFLDNRITFYLKG